MVDGMNLCLSGGALGADLQWGMCAGKAGHSVIHWSFEGHTSFAPDSELVKLTAEQLNMANPAIKTASTMLNKRAPNKPFTLKLIQRNYFQISETSSLYAVSHITDGQVQGGTAWAVAMFLARTDLLQHPCYVFDQYAEEWYSWKDEVMDWEVIKDPPVPSGIWTGVGSRTLLTCGKDAIRKLMNYKHLS